MEHTSVNLHISFASFIKDHRTMLTKAPHFTYLSECLALKINWNILALLVAVTTEIALTNSRIKQC